MPKPLYYKILRRCTSPSVIAATSFLLLTSSVGFWVRSHFWSDQFYVHYDPLLKKFDGLFIESCNGTVGISSMNSVGAGRVYPRLRFTHNAEPRNWYDGAYTRMPNQMLGFRWGPFLGNAGFAIPYYAFVVVFSMPILWTVRTFVATRSRASNGRCLTCGYDLRASSHRCPECGQQTEMDLKAKSLERRGTGGRIIFPSAEKVSVRKRCQDDLSAPDKSS